MTERINKVHFIFNEKCNMDCPFCYLEFHAHKTSTVGVWTGIVERLLAYKPKRITFSGGDPFRYKEFAAFLGSIDFMDTEIQVDTNTLGLKDDYIPILKDKATIVGLPLDGTYEVNLIIRNHQQHYNRVLKWLGVMNSSAIPVKINTVVTRQNVNNLQSLSEILNGYEITNWSLYQFLPIAAGKRNEHWLDIDDQVFLDCTKELEVKTDIPLAIFPRIKRLKNWTTGHMVIDQTGEIFVTKRYAPTESVSCGTIFEPDAIDKWRQTEYLSQTNQL